MLILFIWDVCNEKCVDRGREGEEIKREQTVNYEGKENVELVAIENEEWKDERQRHQVRAIGGLEKT